MENSVESDSYESFRLFVMSILGLTSGTADSYVSYVKGACRIVGKGVAEIVESEETMRSAIAQIEQLRKKDSTGRNYIAGLKAFWRYTHGSEFGTNRSDARNNCSDVAFEIRKQLNELELRVSDSNASFWNRIMDVVMLALTIVPTLLTIGGMKTSVMWFLVASISSGAIGLAAMIPILRRPIRQNTELFEFGKGILNGNVSGFEHSPNETTDLERICERAVRILLPISMLLILISVLITVIAK